MAEPREAFVEHLFDGLAPIYDPMNRIITFGLYGLWQKVLMGKTGLASGQKALDVATGTADLAILMAKRVGAPGSVTGVDLSRGMLRVGEEKVRRAGLAERVHLVEGNALEMPFPDASFDRAVVGFGLRNMSDVGRAVAEMARVVKPGGQVLCLEMSHPENPVIRPLFQFYFDRIVPLVGMLGGRGKEPYEWLPQSLRLFPGRKELEQIFRQSGLTDVISFPLAFGSVAIHRGRVPL